MTSNTTLTSHNASAIKHFTFLKALSFKIAILVLMVISSKLSAQTAGKTFSNHSTLQARVSYYKTTTRNKPVPPKASRLETVSNFPTLDGICFQLTAKEECDHFDYETILVPSKRSKLFKMLASGTTSLLTNKI